jgi:hypothetical protein
MDQDHPKPSRSAEHASELAIMETAARQINLLASALAKALAKDTLKKIGHLGELRNDIEELRKAVKTSRPLHMDKNRSLQNCATTLQNCATKSRLSRNNVMK